MKTRKQHSHRKKQNGFLIFLKIVLWPFKILFKLVYWILRGIWFLLENLFLLFKRKHEYARAKKGMAHDKDAHYSPFVVIESIKGTPSNFENFLIKNQSTIGIILGARGSGKSAFGLKLLENIHAKQDQQIAQSNKITQKNIKKFFTMGFKPNDLPDWINVAKSIDEIENNSYVLIDEGGILFSSRKAFSNANQLLSELLLVARHKDLSVMFISQNSSNLEINAIRQTDYLILKPSSLLQLDFERKKIKDIYLQAMAGFSKYKNTKGLTFIYSDQFNGFITNELPSFWTTGISKSFSGKKKE